MVSKLLDIIQEANGDFGEFSEEQAEYVLTKIEEVGMLPPSYQRRVDNPIPGPGWCVSMNEWEPEDE